MINCHNCKHYFCDDSVGFIECNRADELPDDIYEDYETRFPEMLVCPYYEEIEDINYDFPGNE